MHPRREEDEIIRKHSERTLGVLNREPSISDPPRNKSSAGQVQDDGLGEVHQSVGGATVLSQNGLEFRHVCTGQADGEIVRINTNNEKNSTVESLPAGAPEGWPTGAL